MVFFFSLFLSLWLPLLFQHCRFFLSFFPKQSWCGVWCACSFFVKGGPDGRVRCGRRDAALLLRVRRDREPEHVSRVPLGVLLRPGLSPHQRAFFFLPPSFLSTSVHRSANPRTGPRTRPSARRGGRSSRRQPRRARRPRRRRRRRPRPRRPRPPPSTRRLCVRARRTTRRRTARSSPGRPRCPPPTTSPPSPRRPRPSPVCRTGAPAVPPRGRSHARPRSLRRRPSPMCPSSSRVQSSRRQGAPCSGWRTRRCCGGRRA